jgi:Tfp pilus assembly protein PilF
MTSLADKCFQEACALARQRLFDEAETKFKQALAHKDDHSRTLLEYGLLLQNHRKEYEAAEQLYAKALFWLCRCAWAVGN